MRPRLQLILIGLFSTLLILLMLFLYLAIISFSVRQVEHQGRGDINQFRQLILSQPGDSIDYQGLARLYAETKGIEILIVDMDSNLLADSRSDQATVSRYIDANLSAAKDEEIASSIIRDKQHDSLSIAVGKTLDLDGEEVIVSFTYVITPLQEFTTIFIIFTVLLLAVTAVLIILLRDYAVRQYRKPLHKLLQHTREAAESHGRYQKISLDSGNEELVQLVDQFNSLVDTYDLLITSDNEKYSKINSLLSHIRTGIMIIDLENRVTLINPRAEELLGVNKGDIFLEDGTALKPGSSLEGILEQTRRVHEDNLTRSSAILTEDGLELDVSIEVMFSKYIPYEQSGALVLLRDVTEIRRLEKLKDEFISNVSHELRTPLTVINGFVQTLQSWELISEADRRDSLTIIELETERLKRLISELLVLSRIEGSMDGSDRVYFDPIQVVRDTAASLQPVAEAKEMQLIIECRTEGHLLILGREIWFKQIIANLIDNALKYSTDRGEVVIQVKKDDAGSLQVSITDQGIGIPEEDIPRVFERFYRVEKSRNSGIAGSGLGLAIALLMAQELGGEITLKSRLGEGSTFTVTIPLSEEEGLL